MTAAKRNLVVEKGATFRLNLRLKDSDGNYLNLTDYIGRMQIRTAITDAVPLLDITNTDFTFDANGRCQIKVDDAVTEALPVATDGVIAVAVYDLEIESPAGDVDRLMEGSVKIKPNVTRGVGVSP